MSLCVACQIAKAEIFLNSQNRRIPYGRCRECYERMILASTKQEIGREERRAARKRNKPSQ